MTIKDTLAKVAIWMLTVNLILDLIAAFAVLMVVNKQDYLK